MGWMTVAYFHILSYLRRRVQACSLAFQGTILNPNVQAHFKFPFASCLLMSHCQKLVTGPSVNGRRFEEIGTLFCKSIVVFTGLWKVSCHDDIRLEFQDFMIKMQMRCFMYFSSVWTKNIIISVPFLSSHKPYINSETEKGYPKHSHLWRRKMGGIEQSPVIAIPKYNRMYATRSLFGDCECSWPGPGSAPWE